MTPKSFLPYVVIVIVIALIGALLLFKEYGSNQSKTIQPTEDYNATYRNDNLKLSFNYPKRFSVLEQFDEKDPQKETKAVFSSGQDKITLVFSVKPTTSVQKEKDYNKKFLFQDSGAMMRNSEIIIGESDGFKSLIDFNSSRYVIYRQMDQVSSLIVHIDMISDSADGLLKLESILQSMFSNLLFV